jgi:uncharacterized protein involved in copper resistance
VKHPQLSAALVALALAITSCGGSDDSNDASTPATTTATQQAQTTPGQAGAEQPASDKSKAPGSGGSSSADADRAAQADQSGNSGQSGSTGTKKKAGSKKPKTAAEQLAALPPEQLRKLHKDLYEQGKTACYAFGAEELAKSQKLPSADPVTVARKYAEAYEKATPSLILPYQQGCLAGLRKHERNPPKN